MQPLRPIIRLAQDRDQAAFQYLMAKYVSLLRQECEQYGLNEHVDLSCSDFMQEILAQIWFKLPQFQGVEGEEDNRRVFEGWLRQVTKSVVISLKRSRSAQKRMPNEEIQTYDETLPADAAPQESEPTASSIFIRNESCERVRMAMEYCLNDVTRVIVELHIVDGLSFQEIGERVSLSTNQVRYQFHKACSEMERWLT